MYGEREQGNIAFQHEFESEAFVNNLVRLELLRDGSSVYTSYNSKMEPTAQSYIPQGGIAHA
jgi:hypothetical protein